MICQNGKSPHIKKGSGTVQYHSPKIKTGGGAPILFTISVNLVNNLNLANQKTGNDGHTPFPNVKIVES